jgi:membrane protease YdiL (CAAX protease family)
MISALLWSTEWGSIQGPLLTVLAELLGYGIFLLLLPRLLARAQVAPRALLGPRPAWATLGRYALVAFPLMVVTIAATFLLYLPLSYLWPGVVERWLLRDASVLLWLQGPHAVLANGCNVVLIVLLVPMVEEFVFRGLLLTRWSLKWGVPRGIFASAAVFGLLHADILGGVFFGYVMSVLYIQTRSLFVPMSVHIANNGLVILLEGVDLLTRASYTPSTLAEFQSLWWVGVLATGLIMPWVLRFTQRHVPTRGWCVPYLAEDNAPAAREDGT